MTQSKISSLTESAVNTSMAMVINFILGLLIYPIIGIPLKVHQNIILVLIFTGTSIVRNYIIRRWFNGSKG